MRIDVSVPDAHAAASIVAPTMPGAERIVAALHVVTVDSAGCAVAPAYVALPRVAPATRPGASTELVPGRPSLLTLCEYSGGEGYWGTTLTGSAQDRLVRTLDALPRGSSIVSPTTVLQSACTGGDSTGPDSLDTAALGNDESEWTVTARYLSGPPVVVTIRIGFCGYLGATNGARFGQRTQALVEAMTSYPTSAGWPQLVRRAP